MASIDAPGPSTSSDGQGLKRPHKVSDGDKDSMQVADIVSAAPTTPRSTSHAQAVSKRLEAQFQEWAAITRRGPLQLLDLPVVILKEIVKEVCA